MNIETAKRLYEYRKAHGFSQEELAAKIGVSRPAISKWERSESSPDTDNLIALAQLYGVSLDTLLMGENEPKKEASAQEEKAEDETASADNTSTGSSSTEDQGTQNTKTEEQTTAGNDYSAPTGGTSAAFSGNGAQANQNGSRTFNQNHSANTTYYPPVQAAKKKLSTGSKIIIGLICAIVLIFLAAVIGFSVYDEHVDDIVEYHSEQNAMTSGGNEVDAAGINKISVEWAAGNVNIDYYDGSTISFSDGVDANNKYALGSKTENGELEIDFHKNRSVTGGDEKNLQIYIPQGQSLTEIEVSAASANITINSVNADSLDITTVSGEIIASGEYAAMDIETTSGNAQVTSSAALIRQIDANSVSGNITVIIPQNIDGFHMEYETVSGEITNDFSAKTNGTALRGTANYGNSSTQIEVETVSGNFALRAAQ